MNKNTASVQKEMPEFANEVEKLDTAELNNRLAQLAKDGAEVEAAKEADEPLQTARAQAKEFAAPYREAKKAIKMKSNYIIDLLKGRGVE